MLVNLKEILKIAKEDKSAIGMFNATGFDFLLTSLQMLPVLPALTV